MTPPRSALDWTQECYQKSHRSYADPDTMCVRCANKYAAEQVAQARVEIDQAVFYAIVNTSIGDSPNAELVLERVQQRVAAAIRART